MMLLKLLGNSNEAIQLCTGHSKSVTCLTSHTSRRVFQCYFFNIFSHIHTKGIVPMIHLQPIFGVSLFISQYPSFESRKPKYPSTTYNRMPRWLKVDMSVSLPWPPFSAWTDANIWLFSSYMRSGTGPGSGGGCSHGPDPS